MRSRYTVVAFAALSSVLHATNIITVNFGGEVTSVSLNLASDFPDIVVGDPMTGTYSYDADAPDTRVDPVFGEYATGTLSFQIGATTFQGAGTLVTVVTNDHVSQGDGFSVSSSTFTPTISSASAKGLLVGLTDLSAAVFADDSLPTGPPNLSDWEFAEARVIYRDGASSPDIISCAILSICGDGAVEGAEECDEGTANNSDTTPDACRTDCTLPICGDGVVDTGEECDVVSASPIGGGGSLPVCVNCRLSDEPLPAVSEWGLIVMGLLGLTIGTILYGRRRVAA